MPNERAGRAAEPVSERIERTLTALIGGCSEDPVETGALVAELIAKRAATEIGELRRAESAASALRRTHHEIRTARSLDQIVDAVCPAVAAIASAEFVMFSQLDGARATPLDSFAAGNTVRPLPHQFELPAEVTEDGRLPVVFRDGECTVFRLDLDGSPAAVVHVEGSLDGSTIRAMRALIVSIGSAVELAVLRKRRNRQRELFSAIPGLREGPGSQGRPEFPGRAHPEPPGSLTERERDIFASMLTGAGNSTIARELFVSVETVRSHVKQVLRKCDVSNRAELIGRYRGVATHIAPAERS